MTNHDSSGNPRQGVVTAQADSNMIVVEAVMPQLADTDEWPLLPRVLCFVSIFSRSFGVQFVYCFSFFFTLLEYPHAHICHCSHRRTPSHTYKVEKLCQDMFAGDWCIRHGAVMALREIIKFHGRGAGRRLDGNLDLQNQRWLGDMAVRMILLQPPSIPFLVFIFFCSGPHYLRAGLRSLR